MKYYVTDSKAEGNEFTVAITEDKAEAIKIAQEHWASLTAHDKQRSTVEVRIYEADIEDENCTNYDYDTVEWQYDSFRVSAVYTDGTTIDNDIINEIGHSAIEAELAVAREWFRDSEPEKYMISYYLEGKCVWNEYVD